MEGEAPAAKAIRVLGAKRIAARCDLCTDAVWKWASRNGGLIPARYQRRVYELAVSSDAQLTPADIIGVVAPTPCQPATQEPTP